MSDRDISICTKESETYGGREISVCDKTDSNIPRDIRVCPQEQFNCPAETPFTLDYDATAETLTLQDGETPYYKYNTTTGAWDEVQTNPQGVTVQDCPQPPWDFKDSCGVYQSFTPPDSYTGGPTLTENDGDYDASGGEPPYTFSISCGEISSVGQVTSTSGCCGTGTVTVTDSCGFSDSLPIEYPSGQWVWNGEWDIEWAETETCNYTSEPVAGGPCGETPPAGGGSSWTQYKNVYSYTYDPGGPYESTRWCATTGECVKVYDWECP